MISELHKLYPNWPQLQFILPHLCMFWLWSTYCSSYVFFPLFHCFGPKSSSTFSLYISHPQNPNRDKETSPHKWSMMRACKDHCNGMNLSASFTASLMRHQPLITSSSSSSSSSSIHVENTSTPNHSFGHVSKESSKDCDSSAQAAVSSRWNPTPEQVEVLKEMFRLGTRSPTAEHIQQITTLLRRFGRVEGKNVFYWFQNHKARERQRRRCSKLETICHQEQKCERKKPGVRRACFEAEESSNWGPLPISVCNLLSEEPVSVHRTQASSVNVWTQLDLHHITPTSQLTPNPDSGNTQQQQQQQKQRQYQMLELFPLGKGSNNVSVEQSIPTMSTSFSPSQFVEFLPPKI